MFSDKTGTLTCNIMKFKKFSTNNSSFEVTEKDAADAVIQPDDDQLRNLDFHPLSTLTNIISDKYHAEHADVDAALMCLAICHNVVINKKTGAFNSSSPDEIALLEGVKAQGYQYIGM